MSQLIKIAVVGIFSFAVVNMANASTKKSANSKKVKSTSSIKNEGIKESQIAIIKNNDGSVTRYEPIFAKKKVNLKK